MSLKTFADMGGFKLLAVARLTSASHSIVCYLLNCHAAGIDDLVSSPRELAVLLGIPERLVRDAIEELRQSKIIDLQAAQGKPLVMRLVLDPTKWENLRSPSPRRRRTQLGDAKNIHPLPVHSGTPADAHIPGRPRLERSQEDREGASDGLSSALFEQSPAGEAADAPPSQRANGVPKKPTMLSHTEALMFPSRRIEKDKDKGRGHDALESPPERMRRGGGPATPHGAAPGQGHAPVQLTALEGGRHAAPHAPASKSDPVDFDTQRIVEAFRRAHEKVGDTEKERTYARLLAESHPAEQVLALISHFGKDIPSLSMLAGAWLHYSDKFHRAGGHAEHAEVDFNAYRKKHLGKQRKLRQLAHTELKRAANNKLILNADEELLLRVFIRHDHPRRQLYWALQARERYPHLQDFFAATNDLALSPEPPRKP